MKKLERILGLPLEKLKPLYIAASEDRYILSEFKDKFVEKFVDEDIRDFNFTYLEDSENFPALLKNQVNTPPMMAEKRFIVARTSSYFTEKQEKDELIVSLFTNYPGTTIMVILVDGKVKKSLKTVKTAAEIGEIIAISPPRYAELDKWIFAEFQKRGKKIEQRSVKFLEQMFSNNLQRLESEIEKISLYNLDKDIIDMNSIFSIISRDRLYEENLVFQLTDAIMSREKGKAVNILRTMLDGGAVPLRILSTMTWQIRLLLSVRVLKEKGKNIEEIARVLKSHQYPVKKCYQYCNNFSERELEEILGKFLEANRNIVTGRFIPEQALEMAIIA